MPRGHFHHFHHHSHGHGGRSGPPIPWHFWAKHRSITGTYIISAITVFMLIIDLALALSRYLDEIGYFTIFLIEQDCVILLMQAANFLSIFYPQWMFCGYWLQLFMPIVSLIFALSTRLAFVVSIPIPFYNTSRYSSSKINFGGDVLGVGFGMVFFQFFSFIIWNAVISSRAAQDPEFLSYYSRPNIFA